MVGIDEILKKYRPKSLKDIIGQEEAVEILSRTPVGANLLLYGPPGSGKTSSAYAWAHERGYKVVNEYNASMDRGIGVIREKINRLAFMKTKRVILLDESDNLTPDSMTALRRPLELKYSEVSFIFTANYPYKIIDPIKSRCINVPFKRLSDNSLLKVLIRILKGEGVKIHDSKQAKNILLNLSRAVNGDARMAINYLLPVISEGEFKPLKFLETVPELRLNQLAKETIEKALAGRLNESIKKLEDFLAEAGLQTEVVFRVLYSVVINYDLDNIQKSLILNGLAEAERGVRLGGDMILQLGGVLGKIQLYRVINHGLNSGEEPPPVKYEKPEEETAFEL